jgi:phosphatidate phosphatase APP1
LYPELEEFRRASDFPDGTFHLKTFRWKDESFFDLFQSPVEYKLGVIEPLLEAFPRRRFRLVGDSGEADPEVYGELARRYPGQIERILIRELSGATRQSERYRAAFREVPAETWSLFSEPRENAAQPRRPNILLVGPRRSEPAVAMVRVEFRATRIPGGQDGASRSHDRSHGTDNPGTRRP